MAGQGVPPPPPEIDPVGQLENPKLPFKDPERQRAAVRESMRSARGSAPPAPPGDTLAALADAPLETAADCGRVLGALVRDLLTRDLDPTLRAKTVTYVVQTHLRAIELGDLESELQDLRQLVEDQAAAAEPPLGRWRS